MSAVEYLECGDTVRSAFTAFSYGNTVAKRHLPQNCVGLYPREKTYERGVFQSLMKAANEAFGFFIAALQKRNRTQNLFTDWLESKE